MKYVFASHLPEIVYQEFQHSKLRNRKLFRVRTPEKENGIFLQSCFDTKIEILESARKVRKISNLVLLVFFARTIHGLEVNVDDVLNMGKFDPWEQLAVFFLYLLGYKFIPRDLIVFFLYPNSFYTPHHKIEFYSHYKNQCDVRT